MRELVLCILHSFPSFQSGFSKWFCLSVQLSVIICAIECHYLCNVHAQPPNSEQETHLCTHSDHSVPQGYNNSYGNCELIFIIACVLDARITYLHTANRLSMLIAYVITTPNATPGRLHHSLRDDGVTTTPQDVVSILGSHTSTSGTHAGRAPLKAPKPPRDVKHHPTPVRTKLSHHVSQMGGPSWTVPSQSYVYCWIVDNLAEGNKVAYRVVDTWACVLNYRELTKDAALPNRLFASTKTALQSAVNYTALWSLRLGWFTKSLDEDFSNSPHEIWRGIHIVDLLSTFLDDKLETEIAS
nr:uncharacterized protein LOC109177111 [Ipomoea batatas]